jgi:uncharacterized protein YhaN
MRIRQLQLIRYGKFTDHVLDLPAPLPDTPQDTPPDIHLIVGPNEAGKSTTRAALGDWLFGIKAQTSMAFLHPMPELRLAGVLEAQGQQLAFQRCKGNKNTLRASHDQPLPDTALLPWLGDVQRPLFEQMFSLDHAALLAGGAGILSAADDVGRMLFQSASGLEQLGRVLQGLEDEADGLWAPRKSEKRLYYQAHTDMDAAQQALKQATARAKGWKELRDALADIEQQLLAVRTERTQAQRQRQQLERVRRVAPYLQRLDAAVQLVQAQATLPADSACLALAVEIQELDARRVQYRAHRPDMEKRAAELHQHWLKVQASAHSLAWPSSNPEAVRQRLPTPAMRARLAALLQSHGLLQQQRQFAQQQLAAQQQTLGHTQAQLQALAVHSDTTALQVALEQAQQCSQQASQWQALQEQLAESQSALALALQALGPYALPLPQLQALLVPDATEVQALLLAQRHDQAALEAAQNQQQTQQAELEQLQAALEQSVAQWQPISQQQVQQARQARDAYWQQICATPTTTAPADVAQWLQYQRLLLQADALADARLERIEYEAQYQAQAQRLERLALELAQQVQRSQLLHQRLQERQQQWQQLVQACPLPAGLPLAAAGPWLEQRKQVLALQQTIERCQRQSQAMQQAQQQAHTALLALLWPTPTPAPKQPSAASPPSLAECIAQARQRLAAAERLHGQRASLEQQANSARRTLQQLQTESQQAQQQWHDWQQQWQQALQAANYPSDTPADAVRSALDTMEQIHQGLEKIDSIRTERIEAMQADLDALAVAAHALCQRLAPELQSQSPEDQILALHQRLSAAQENQRQQQHAQQTLAQVQAQLQAQSDGLPLDALRAEVQTLASTDIPSALQALDAQDKQWQSRTEELSASAQDKRSQLTAFDGGDRAAQAEGQRQEAITRMADAAQRYVQLHTMMRCLRWSIARFRETQQGPMLALASQIFAQLTLGAFERLIVDSEGDKPRLYGCRPLGAGPLVGVEGLSEGSRDQLYLALRLAALHMHLQPGRAMPFVADDLFINFDDQRTSAGLQALGALARKTQVIFLTHHAHLVPLARQALGPRLNVLHLPP